MNLGPLRTLVAWLNARLTNLERTVAAGGGGGGSGTVEDVAVTAGTGIAASVANPTDHPNVSIALAAISDQRVLANISGGSAAPIPNTLSAVLDAILGSTQGQIITRNAGTWTVLNPGTATYVLTSGGAGANLAWAAAAGGSSFGYTSKSADYTLVLADANQGFLHPSTDANARTFTIPANASVAFAVGTYIVFVNGNNGANLSIAITTDTMRLAGSGTTGTRTLAPNGVCTATKIASTEWLISGTGLT